MSRIVTARKVGMMTAQGVNNNNAIMGALAGIIYREMRKGTIAV